ncbi:hypothetical protein BT96DRAFT_914819 [Gymnopus androsaceus JB14]|uniref:Uncharacterized protein n=1 Tax=Gymnopus androsaceus JB14 TaxID=1447944 RepID=A0A6A4I5J7_9AGAR|nr:hypothetical protein BT96DRAFT_914819 [Gymnopus androsaceus JB14]
MTSESASSSAPGGSIPAETTPSLASAFSALNVNNDPETATDPKPSSDDAKASTNATSDPLQVAAQQYPWLYMTSTLDACFKDAEKNAKSDIKVRSDALDQEEAGTSDQRTRLEAGQSIEFYDELSSDKFAKDAPKIMQTFLSHGDACTELEAEALRIASKDLSNIDFDSMIVPLQEYNDVLDRLGTLLMEAFELESAILRLTVSTTSESESEAVESSETETKQPSEDSKLPNLNKVLTRSQIAPVFSACLPIVRARAGNIAMAQQLVEGAKQNLSMTIHLENYYDDDDED